MQSIVDERSLAAAKRYTDAEAVSEARKRLKKWKAKEKKEQLKAEPSGGDSPGTQSKCRGILYC